mmetsp:Transcript_88793/g.256086  ORF Transcript_88793/g.256086 Transcript_88793/m.256086 type:complete len:416 (+) Transcript_88793:498-1745(+)
MNSSNSSCLRCRAAWRSRRLSIRLLARSLLSSAVAPPPSESASDAAPSDFGDMGDMGSGSNGCSMAIGTSMASLVKGVPFAAAGSMTPKKLDFRRGRSVSVESSVLGEIWRSNAASSSPLSEPDLLVDLRTSERFGKSVTRSFGSRPASTALRLGVVGDLEPSWFPDFRSVAVSDLAREVLLLKDGRSGTGKPLAAIRATCSVNVGGFRSTSAAGFRSALRCSDCFTGRSNLSVTLAVGSPWPATEVACSCGVGAMAGASARALARFSRCEFRNARWICSTNGDVQSIWQRASISEANLAKSLRNFMKRVASLLAISQMACPSPRFCSNVVAAARKQHPVLRRSSAGALSSSAMTSICWRPCNNTSMSSIAFWMSFATIDTARLFCCAALPLWSGWSSTAPKNAIAWSTSMAVNW